MKLLRMYYNTQNSQMKRPATDSDPNRQTRSIQPFIVPYFQGADKPLINSRMHIALHFLLPALVAGLFYRKDWKKAYLIMIATIVVDLDHLLADPVYDPTRCSIGFHLLHGLLPISLYFSFLCIKKLRLAGIGLVLHMILDSVDCQITNGVWYV